LRAALTLAIDGKPEQTDREFSRSVPLRGEGDDLASLFADLLEDLFIQIADFGAALHDLRIDGLLRRDRGGLVAWGYVTIADEPSPAVTPPRLHGWPVVLADEQNHVILRATLTRDQTINDM
jgi:hypothetical protein